MTAQHNKPDLFLTMPHACSYLDERIATTLFVDPKYECKKNIFSRFMQLGFRRSGNLVYRPHCEDCQACVSVRIPVDRFVLSRSQKRTLQRNQDVRLTKTRARYSEDHFQLYCQYQNFRHPGGDMANTDPAKYMEFLLTGHTETWFYEMRINNRSDADHNKLLGVAVIDELEDGLSAVYTFFDPDQGKRALGVFAILKEIELAKQAGLPHVYLGYWIENCQKMSYKNNYQPLEGFIDGQWSILEKTAAL
jgi:arginyl-tRNA--protein-N-Asp/Glu arginylyltransferase